MVVGELLATAIERAAALAGAHGLEAGLLASALLVLWHGHSALAFLQSALKTVRVGFVGAALVGLLLVVGLSLGWISIGTIPSVGDLLAGINLEVPLL